MDQKLIDDLQDDKPLVDGGGDVHVDWVHDGGRGRATRVQTCRCRSRARVGLGPHDHSRFRRYPGTAPYRPHVVCEWPLPNYPAHRYNIRYAYKVWLQWIGETVHRYSPPARTLSKFHLVSLSISGNQHRQAGAPWENRLVPPGKK